MTLVNEKKWNELPKSYQAALQAACGEASVWMPAKYDAQNPAALRRLVASGTKLRPFPKAGDGGLREGGLRALRRAQAKSAHWKRIYPAVEEVPRRSVPVVPRRRDDLRQLRVQLASSGQGK